MSDDVILYDSVETAVVRAEPDVCGRAVRQYVRTQLSPRSQQNALDALRRVARLVAGPGAAPEAFPWPAVNYELVQMLRRALYDQTRAGTITPGTANLTLSHVRGIVRTMYGMKIISSEQLAVTHPGILKSVPGARASRGEALTVSAERELRGAARSLAGYRGALLDSAIVLAIGGGLRREEVVGAELESLEPGGLHLVGKGNKEREVPVDGAVREVVDGWLRVRGDLLPDHSKIFCSPQRPNGMLSKWSFWSLVRHAAHEAFGNRKPCDDSCRCLQVVTGPHDFRRTFATRLLEQGFDIRQVQVLMGHASPETTARYDKRAEEQLFERRRQTRVIA